MDDDLKVGTIGLDDEVPDLEASDDDLGPSDNARSRARFQFNAADFSDTDEEDGSMVAERRGSVDASDAASGPSNAKPGGWSFKSAIAQAAASEAASTGLVESLADKVRRKRKRNEEERSKSKGAKGEARERVASEESASDSDAGSETDSSDDDEEVSAGEDEADAGEDGTDSDVSGSDSESASGSANGGAGAGASSASDDEESDGDESGEGSQQSESGDSSDGGSASESSDSDDDIADDTTRTLEARGEATAKRRAAAFFAADPFAAGSKSGAGAGAGSGGGSGADGAMAEPQTWAEMHLSRPLMRAVADLKYKSPTPIQRRTVPLGMAGRDVCGSAETGSGKTAAFLLPVLERLLYRDKRIAAIRCVVISPTRELASQTWSMLRELNKYTDIRSCLVVGGLSLKAQEAELRTRPDVVVCTPGRMIDHLRNSMSVHLDDVDILVLDEADRLLELGFTEEVEEVVKACPKGRQTLMFSATMTDDVDKLVKMSLKRPVRVSADPLYDLSQRLVQEFVRVRDDREEDREAILLALVTRTFRAGTIVFFQRKKRAHRAAILLGLAGVKVGELHGNLSQRQRLEALEAFRTQSVDVLVATDLAGRGLDIDGVKHVINFQMPNDIRVYVHRVGRTARAGRGGMAVTLVGERGRGIMRQIVKHAKGNLRSRQVQPKAVVKWRARIEKMEGDVEDILRQEQLEKEVRVAEMEANKAKNMMEHESEIASRPARTWFLTAKEKAETKREALEEMMGKKDEAADEEDGEPKLSAKQRKKAALKAMREEAKLAAEKKPHRLTRKKRRRLEMLAEDKELEKAARRAQKAGTSVEDAGLDPADIKAMKRSQEAQRKAHAKAKHAKTDARARALERNTTPSNAMAKKEKAKQQRRKRKLEQKEARRAARRSATQGGTAFDVDMGAAGAKGKKGGQAAASGKGAAQDPGFLRGSTAGPPGSVPSGSRFTEKEGAAREKKMRKPGQSGKGKFKSKGRYKRR